MRFPENLERRKPRLSSGAFVFLKTSALLTRQAAINKHVTPNEQQPTSFRANYNKDHLSEQTTTPSKRTTTTTIHPNEQQQRSLQQTPTSTSF
jgi:hypothetical protein